MDEELMERRENNVSVFEDNPARFERWLREDMREVQKAARHRGLAPAVQLNAFSDVDFVAMLGKSFFDEFSAIQFFDLTRDPNRTRTPNYDLALSIDASDLDGMIQLGVPYSMRLAIVARNRTVKRDLMDSPLAGYQWANGDLHPLTFPFPRRSILLFVAKQEAMYDTTGFVLRGANIIESKVTP